MVNLVQCIHSIGRTAALSSRFCFQVPELKKYEEKNATDGLEGRNAFILQG